MKRRTFLQSSALVASLPVAAAIPANPTTVQKELYEIRTYETRFGGDRQLLLTYLTTALQPAMERKGVNYFQVFLERGEEEPIKVWVLIAYPSAEVYLSAQQLTADSIFDQAAADYNALPAAEPTYNRFTASLFLAFDGLPQLLEPQGGATVFELRTYEAASEALLRRKINMFNQEELDLFNRVGLHSVFFGEMLAGPYRPCLTYMLGFKDMEERNANWAAFAKHPDWNAMKVKPEYANSVSNIHKIFLKPA